MAYSSYQEALDAKNRAWEAFKVPYRTRQSPGTGRWFHNIPWSAQQAFSAKWDPIVQQARHNQGKANPNPASRYASKMTPAQRRAVDNRVNAAAAKAYANPSFRDPAPTRPQRSPATRQPNPVSQVAATYQSKIKELQDMMTQQSLAQQQQQQQWQQTLAAQQQQMQQSLAQQQQNFAIQQQQMQESLAAQQEAYNKQAQQMANSQRAYTPAPEATATETTTTDSGISVRRNARSGLSSLAIIEGLGTNANPLSGLQLA